ncbi:hypothetical protein [Nannocystis exedens]|uniref:hypothetical protein n=1 Tax=Nannocystis exedens TaxID=54 RepID=UPI000BBA0DC9|nr:hypothetical protein [Nannocystis exedens]PCC66472.1 hypothetical protein NAEX_09060 [Nannocystis exedens]
MGSTTTTRRIIVRTVEAGGAFDGSTPEVLEGYGTPPNVLSNTVYAYKVGETVGRFGIGALGRNGYDPALVRARLVGTPQPGDELQVRSGVSGLAAPFAALPGGDQSRVSQPNTPATTLAPQDAPLIVGQPLTNQWGHWLQLGPTDALAVFHIPAGGAADTVEIEVVEGPSELLAAIFCCRGCGGGDCEAVNLDLEVSDETPETQIAAWACDLHVNATVATPGALLILPPIAGMATGASVLISRRGGTWFKVVSPDGVNGVTSPDGVVFDNDAMAVLFEPTADGWSASDRIQDLAPQPLPGAATDIPAAAGVHIFQVSPNDGDIALPPTAEVAPGQVYLVAQQGDRPLRINLADPLSEDINGVLGAHVRLTNRGDQAVFLRDGEAGWRLTWNLYGRYAALDTVSADEVFGQGWPGTLSRRYDQVAALIGVTLPDPSAPLPPKVGTRLHAFRSEPGVIAFAAPNAEIIGKGAPTSILAVGGADVWHFLEYEGNNVWSYSSSAPSQERRSVSVTDANTPQTLAALTHDVTIVSVSSNNDANVVVLPPLPTDLAKILRVVNIGPEDFVLTAAVGQAMNGTATTTILSPNQGVTLQPNTATTFWHVTGG